MTSSNLQPDAITNELRQQIREELPEIDQIRDADLGKRSVEAWAYALTHSSFTSIKQIAPSGNPDVNEVVRGDQTDHLRGVTRMAVAIANEMQSAYPELEVDMDIVLA